MAINRLALNITNIVLSVINIVFHTFGITLMSSLNKKEKSPQNLMILNLSIAELINSLVRMLIIIIFMLPPPYMPVFKPPMPGGGGPGLGGNSTNMTGPPKGGPPSGPPPMTDAQLTAHYLNAFSMTGFFFVIFLIMMAITLDRLLIVLLKSSYNKVCSMFNTKILIGFIWIVGIAMIIGFPIGHHVDQYDHRYHFEYHVYLVTDVVFLVFAIFVFLVIFVKYRDYEVATNSNEKQGKSGSPIVRMLCNPVFYIPLLIIFTYFIFIILPHWIYIGKKYEEKSKDMDHWAAMIVMLLLGYWADAVVYIFLQPKIRKLMKKWLCLHSTRTATFDNEVTGGEVNPSYATEF